MKIKLFFVLVLLFVFAGQGQARVIPSENPSSVKDALIFPDPSSGEIWLADKDKHKKKKKKHHKKKHPGKHLGQKKHHHHDDDDDDDDSHGEPMTRNPSRPPAETSPVAVVPAPGKEPCVRTGGKTSEKLKNIAIAGSLGAAIGAAVGSATGETEKGAALGGLAGGIIGATAPANGKKPGSVARSGNCD